MIWWFSTTFQVAYFQSVHLDLTKLGETPYFSGFSSKCLFRFGKTRHRSKVLQLVHPVRLFQDCPTLQHMFLADRIQTNACRKSDHMKCSRLAARFWKVPKVEKEFLSCLADIFHTSGNSHLASGSNQRFGLCKRMLVALSSERIAWSLVSQFRFSSETAVFNIEWSVSSLLENLGKIYIDLFKK